jgi:hypothetical protein
MGAARIASRIEALRSGARIKVTDVMQESHQRLIENGRQSSVAGRINPGICTIGHQVHLGILV